MATHLHFYPTLAQLDCRDQFAWNHMHPIASPPTDTYFRAQYQEDPTVTLYAEATALHVAKRTPDGVEHPVVAYARDLLGAKENAKSIVFGYDKVNCAMVVRSIRNYLREFMGLGYITNQQDRDMTDLDGLLDPS